MIKIIPPAEFKTIPWKNGKGLTTELAISEGGTLGCFDWRISSAAVVEDGQFSDFSGYQRHLVLLEGEGLVLTHDQASSDTLDHFLAVAAFSGNNKTWGELLNGPIVDLNLISNTSQYQTQVKVLHYFDSIDLDPESMHFIYSPENKAFLKNHSVDEEIILPANHLLQCMDSQQPIVQYSVSGASLIVMSLNLID